MVNLIISIFCEHPYTTSVTIPSNKFAWNCGRYSVVLLTEYANNEVYQQLPRYLKE